MTGTFIPPMELGILRERAGEFGSALRLYQQAAHDESPAVQAEALRRQADVHRVNGDWDLALECVRQSLAVATREALPVRVVEALNAEGIIHFVRGEHDRAQDCWEAGLLLTQDARLRGLLLTNLGVNAAMRQDLVGAGQFFRQAHAMYEGIGFTRGAIRALINLACVLMDEDEFSAAAAVLTRAWAELAEADKMERQQQIQMQACLLLNRAECRLWMGDRSLALKDAGDALNHFRTGRDRRHTMECFRVMGDYFALVGDTSHSTSYYEKARAIAALLGIEPELKAKIQKTVRRRQATPFQEDK